MKSISKRGKKKKMALQLTSLLDMFTIILVFLMVSFQAEDMDFVMHPGIALPVSTVKNPFKTGVNMAITSGKVLIEGKQVYQLSKGGKVKESDFEAGKIDSVVQAVEAAWKLHKREKDEEDIVVIQADQTLPYKTLHLLMRSAAHAGVFRFRLVVEKE
ncbi:MAG: biopolymer transporter ExbD [Deltaproteobacteria bacterium]|nr:biopolymer transporter ExbD [Deltaproteobacteria bacterium]